MAIQLTRDQEERIQAIVKSGAYSSPGEAIEAAVAAVESVAQAGFDGSAEEIEALLVAGLDSRELTDEEFWASVDRETNAMLDAAKHSPRS